MELNWTEIILAVIAILAGVVTHKLDKRKHRTEIEKLKAEVNSDNIGNMDKSLEFYEKWVTNTNKRLDEVLHNQNKLMNENLSLRNELNTVKEQTTRMSTLLCTKLPCNERVQDASIIDCIYLSGNKRQAKKLAKQQNKKKVEKLKSE